MMEYGTNDPEALARLKELQDMTAEAKAALEMSDTTPTTHIEESTGGTYLGMDEAADDGDESVTVHYQLPTQPQPTCPAPDTWVDTTKRLEREHRHWQAFLAALTGLCARPTLQDGGVWDKYSLLNQAQQIADEVDRQYRGPEEQGNG